MTIQPPKTLADVPAFEAALTKDRLARLESAAAVARDEIDTLSKDPGAVSVAELLDALSTLAEILHGVTGELARLQEEKPDSWPPDALGVGAGEPAFEIGPDPAPEPAHA